MATGKNSNNVAHHYWDVSLKSHDTGVVTRYRRIGPAATQLRALRILLSNQYFPNEVLDKYRPAEFSISISRVDTYE